MTVRSRTIVLTVPTETVTYYFRIRGITSINFVLDTKVGTAQGIASNFVHPWFIGPVDIKLSGSTYIGTFYNVQDKILDETKEPSDPVKPKPFKETLSSIGTSIKEGTYGRFKRLAESLRKKKPKETKKGTPVYSYPAVQQFPTFIGTLYKISETVRTGRVKRNSLVRLEGGISRRVSEIVKQQLTISDYLGPGKNLIFDGFISDVSITEEQGKLGIIKFSISFKGILRPMSVEKLSASSGTESTVTGDVLA
jgi:hypothetical protein